MTDTHQKTLASLGATITNHLEIIHSVALRVPNRSLGRLAALPFVAHLSLDGQTKKSDEFTVQATGADAARQQYALTGSGVTVAVIDSGISLHDDFLNMTPGTVPTSAVGYRIGAAVSFVSNGAPKLPPYYGNPEAINGPDVQDACGHGTHVAGILGGNGIDSTSGLGYVCYRTFTGIAPQATLVNVKVLNNNGSGVVRRRRLRDPVGRHQREDLQYSDHQSLARPPRRRELYDRPALPGGGSGGAGRHRRRLRGRQQRSLEPDREHAGSGQ